MVDGACGVQAAAWSDCSELSGLGIPMVECPRVRNADGVTASAAMERCCGVDVTGYAVAQHFSGTPASERGGTRHPRRVTIRAAKKVVGAAVVGGCGGQAKWTLKTGKSGATSSNFAVLESALMPSPKNLPTSQAHFLR
jgi:hypothetical protein